MSISDPTARDAGYHQLGGTATAKEWIEYASSQPWRAGGEPTVFISFNREDYSWISQIELWLKGSLESMICPETKKTFQTQQYADPRAGTSHGEQYTVPLVKQMWTCRAAIVVLSQGYMQSEICSKKELPFLIWRHLAHKIPLFIVRTGLISEEYEIVRVPDVPGSGPWPPVDLRHCTDDRQPAFNRALNDPTSGLLISQLDEGHPREQRLKAFAKRVSEDVIGFRPKTSGKDFEEASTQIVRPKPTLPDVQFGVFPGVDVFEGRVGQLELLAEAARETKFAVAGVAEMGGLGKTTLILKFIEKLKERGPHRFEGIFRFTFYGGRTQEDCADALFEFLTQQLNEPPPKGTRSVRTWLGDTLRRRAVLLFLDGMEEIQSPSGTVDKGALKQGPVKNLLQWLCQGRSPSSLAILTSRLPFKDLEKFRGSQFLPFEVPGLAPEEGAEVLRQLGLVDDYDELKRYVADLGGHPLGLVAFADSVLLTPPGNENAASRVARDVELAKPGTVEDKLRRILIYYRERLSPLEASVLSAIAVIPDDASADIVMGTIEDQTFDQVLRQANRLNIDQCLHELTRHGLLQVSAVSGQARYTCHPIIRECFRPNMGSFAQSAAFLQIADRPGNFQPHTLEQVRPYLRAIATLTENGDFRTANRILVQKLESGDLLSKFGALREAFDCFMSFLRRDWEEACLKALRGEWFNAILPRVVDVCMGLNEWELARYYNELDRIYIRPEHPSDQIGNQIRQAMIESEIGSLDEASRVFGMMVSRRDLEQWANILPALAETERLRGRWRHAIELLREWRAYRPSSPGQLIAWLSNWNNVLLTAARILSHVAPAEVKRFLASVDRAVPVAPDFIQSRSDYLEYTSLDLRDNESLSKREWGRKLELAEILGKNANRLSAKGAEGGWMVGVMDALNGLGQADDVFEDYARLTLSQLHENSFRRSWVEMEIARSYLLRGKFVLARQTAEAARRRAEAVGYKVLARSASELLQEILPKAPDPKVEAEARQTVEWFVKESLSPDDIPNFSPLPGEAEWDAHVTELLLGCVSKLDPVMGEDSEIDSAFRLAAELGLTEAIEGLSRHGANAKKADKDGLTALAYAVRAGQEHALELLLRKQKGVNLSDEYDQRVFVEAVRVGHSAILRRLLSFADEVTAENLTPFCEAIAQSGDEALLNAILAFDGGKGASVNIDLPRLLLIAARHGNFEVVKYLGSKVSLSATDENHVTALITAAAGGHLQIIDYLADNHVDVTAKAKDGRTALDITAMEGNVGALIHLATKFDLAVDDKRHKLRALVSATGKNNEREVERALLFGFRPDEVDDRGWTAFVAAARLQNEGLLRKFLEITPRISIDVCDQDGETAVMAAAGNGRETTLELLLRERASPELANSQGLTAFDIALVSGQATTLKVLLRHSGRYLHAGNAFKALWNALRAGRKEALAPVFDEPQLAAMIASAVSPNPNADSGEQLEFLRLVIAHAHKLPTAMSPQDWPTRHPSTLTDVEASGQKCVVAELSAVTFGGLVKAPAPVVIAERFAHLLANANMPTEAFDAQGLRATQLPFLSGSWLVLLPHASAGIEVPFVLNDHGLIWATAVNAWIYDIMNASSSPFSVTAEVALAFVRFFFAVVIGEDGAFCITERGMEPPWLDDATEEVKMDFAAKLVPLAYHGMAEDGRHKMRGTVVFKNALFETSIMLNQKWEMELTEESLLMEDLPIHFGLQVELLVRW